MKLSILTEHIADVDLKNEPAVCLISVGAKDSEDGALFARLGQQLVHVDLLLGELELVPCLALISAEPAPYKASGKGKALQRLSLPCSNTSESSSKTYSSLVVCFLWSCNDGDYHQVSGFAEKWKWLCRASKSLVKHKVNEALISVKMAVSLYMCI